MGKGMYPHSQSFPLSSFFECLQYSKLEGEGLINFILWMTSVLPRYIGRGGGGGGLLSKEHISDWTTLYSAVGNGLYRQFTRPFPLLRKWVWLARPIFQNLLDLDLPHKQNPYLKYCPFSLASCRSLGRVTTLRSRDISKSPFQLAKFKVQNCTFSRLVPMQTPPSYGRRARAGHETRLNPSRWIAWLLYFDLNFWLQTWQGIQPTVPQLSDSLSTQ